MFVLDSRPTTVTVTVTAPTSGVDSTSETTGNPSSSGKTSSDRLGEIGNPYTNGGITLTVTKASSPGTYPRNSTSYQKNSGYDEYEDVGPRSGGKFIRIDTIVKNETKHSIDLTCGLPVITKVVDASENMYEPVDDLEDIQGTPECNEDLNPGFASKMTWVFEVPRESQVLVFVFADYDLDYNDRGKYIRLDPPL